VPAGTPPGSPSNVAQTYQRFADAKGGAGRFDCDFDLAVTRHRLVDAIERSAAEARAVRL
jgi:predicted dehydrogenase